MKKLTLITALIASVGCCGQQRNDTSASPITGISYSIANYYPLRIMPQGTFTNPSVSFKDDDKIIIKFNDTVKYVVYYTGQLDSAKGKDLGSGTLYFDWPKVKESVIKFRNR